MNKRNLLIAGAVLLAVVGVGAFLFYQYFQSLITFKPLTIGYATVQTLMPEGATCAGGSRENTGVAKEIIDLDKDLIYVAGGTNPMPDDMWANYRFGLPILKNSTRNLLFDGSCFFRSPSAPATCEGAACFLIADIVGYTWLELNSITGQSCFPDATGCSADVVKAGSVSVTTIAKCHRIIYNGPSVYELSDGKGNLYVMHATATGKPDLNPQLPAGWTVTERRITEPLELLPFGGDNACYYNIVRDNLVQSYHQYRYAGAQYPPTSPETGMAPIMPVF